jgi:hypothetical protein
MMLALHRGQVLLKLQLDDLTARLKASGALPDEERTPTGIIVPGGGPKGVAAG